MDYALPIAYALFLWWFSTGLIFYLDQLPVRTFKWSMAGATAVLGLSFYAMWSTADDTSRWAAYVSFSGGLLAWGWQEISLYTGFVTGPRKTRCAAGCSGWRHFGHAIQVNLWHEIAIILVAIAIAAMTWESANQWGLWTYLLLWSLHLSARLNVFLGVRNVSEEFVPAHMEVLKSFLTRKPMNLLFPFSVTAATIGAVLLFGEAFSAEADHHVTGYSLLAALMALAVVEHWFLMLPLPVEKLWHWSLPARRNAAKSRKPAPPKFDYTTLKTNPTP
ncbi:putative photosynthetic complex assembly protein PuhE [Aestuariivirga sp.]|uniref:putative photosynthetic complex assembly protein PuhE n=1 Tax=Aestuariivirga sp. TaxID=2650926 RepID=UPI00359395C3